MQNLSQVAEDEEHHLITNRPGVNGLACLVNAKLIYAFMLFELCIIFFSTIV